MGVRQWIREVEVILGSGGTGLSVKELRIQFEIEKTAESAPNTAKIKIYNLTPEHEEQIKEEFDEVIVNAGYKDNIGMIFRGNIKHVYRYRDKTDTITEIEAGDGDKDFRLALLNTTFAAGSTNHDIIDASVDSFQGVGNTQRGTIAVPGKAYLRGKVVTGNTRAALDNISKECGVNWSIQDGELHMVGVDDYLPGEIPAINKDTGMLGSPTVTEKGVEVKCLLNNLLRVNGQIELDRSTINEKKTSKKFKKSKSGKDKPVLEGTERTDATGLYKILNLKHKGDNRSIEWVTTSICLFVG